MTKMKTAIRLLLYIYLFTLAPALIVHMICFESKLIDLLFLIPLMIFSASYGLYNFKIVMTRQGN